MTPWLGISVLEDHPGLIYVAATLLPLASFVLLLLAFGVRSALWPLRETGIGRVLYQSLGGDTPGRGSAYIATAAIGLACILSVIGFFQLHGDLSQYRRTGETASEGMNQRIDQRWAGHLDWARVGPATGPAAAGSKALQLGYRIDSLTALMFLMVTFVAMLIHVFSIGYMSDELKPVVEDHQVHMDHGHLQRRGRFGRFFLFMSLFCFSMLNLILADNLFQVFVSWELVGLCSYLLIGYYYERRSASDAANKAFIVNRVGDVGFILGLLIVWTMIGTFNFQEIFTKLPGLLREGSLPAWLLTAAGLGIFLGCVGKSAQFPLHVWLPDAMEGPTPVSALIHAATMVAAGVYLVGRVFPLFTPDARLVIAYTGGITLFVAATIAMVMTDIKRVLAYSTVSQLGYMILGLGVGGWVAGLFHLLTHAFFKALLFLCSGSVIYGCHHEQDMERMGGLYPKMKVTALTMLAGVLAICGMPFFSGWYSKDAIIAQSLGFWQVYPQHFLLFLLPLITAGITAFYMFRLWFLTFAGEPRDADVYEQAHESPRTMTVPLIILAVFSIGVAWGTPPWEAEHSFLGGHESFLQTSEPLAALHQLGLAEDYHAVHEKAGASHSLAEATALVVGIIGFVFAAMLYWARFLDPAEAKEQFPALHRFLWHKWYFDELYSVLFVRPALVVAGWCRSFDMRVIDGMVDGLGRGTVRVSKWDGVFDLGIVDGLVNLTAYVIYGVGARLRRIQTGYLRSYVLFLVLAVIGIFAVLSYFVSLALAG